MATVNEQNLKKAERILYRKTEFVKEQAANLYKILYDVCADAPARSDEEIQEEINKTFENLNLKEYFEQNIQFLVDDKVFQKEGADDVYQINLICLWIPITREKVSMYEKCNGEERKKYIDELYMRKLCERLKED